MDGLATSAVTSDLWPANALRQKGCWMKAPLSGRDHHRHQHARGANFRHLRDAGRNVLPTAHMRGPVTATPHLLTVVPVQLLDSVVVCRFANCGQGTSRQTCMVKGIMRMVMRVKCTLAVLHGQRDRVQQRRPKQNLDLGVPAGLGLLEMIVTTLNDCPNCPCISAASSSVFIKTALMPQIQRVCGCSACCALADAPGVCSIISLTRHPDGCDIWGEANHAAAQRYSLKDMADISIAATSRGRHESQ